MTRVRGTLKLEIEGQVIYDWPTVHINSLKDLARAGIISVKLVHQLLLKLW